jgi:hypothetical protein
MKTTTFFATILCVLFSVFALFAQAGEIPGGVAYSTGSDILYYDFVAKERRSMVTDSEKFGVSGPFAVSENGSKLIFASADKIYTKILPAGKILPFKLAGQKKGKLFREGIDLIVSGPRNLAIPPNGENFSFEVEDASKFGPCNAVVVIKLDGDSENIIHNRARISKFGNPPMYNGGQTTPDYGGIDKSITLTRPDAMQRFSIRRDGHFGAWSKNSKLIAAIYQTSQFSWGPVEIRDITVINAFYKGKDDYEGKKPGVYEIPMQLKSCQGLAWSEKGLTIITGRKLYLFPMEEIENGIQNSGLARNPDPTYYLPVPINNILNIRPVLVAEGIWGDKFHWSGESFFYRNEEGIFCWQNGMAKQVVPKSPPEYSYVNLAQGFNSQKGVAHKTNGLKSFRGKGSFPEILSAGQGRLTYFNVGGIRTGWWQPHPEDGWLFLHLIVQGQEPLEFCNFPEGTDMESLDPREIKFIKAGFTTKNGGRTVEKKHEFNRIALGYVTALKLGNEVAVVKSNNIQGKTMDCEWIHYPDIRVIGAAQRVANNR